MPSNEKRFFYGWVIVAVSTLSLVVSNGLAILGMPVFYKWVREDFVGSGTVAIDSAESFVARAASLTFLFAGLISPVSGWLIQRFSLKNLMLLGCFILGGGLLLHATATSTMAVYTARILMGVSLGFIGVMPNVVLVSKWFVRRRGTAIGIVLTGTSVGGVVMPLISTALIEAFGWRTAMILASLIIWLILAPAVVFLVRSRPSDIGEVVDGGADLETVEQNQAGGVTLAQALRTPLFWIFALGAALIFYPLFVTTQQLILQTAKIGFTPWQNSLVLSALFAVSVAGKFLFGYLSDQFAPVRVILVCTAVMFASTLLLLDLNATTAVVFLIPFGLGYGGALVLLQRLVADLFGDRDYPKILGAITISETLGAVVGGLISGWLADRLGGDYSTGFHVVIAATGAAMLLMILLNFNEQGRGVRNAAS